MTTTLADLRRLLEGALERGGPAIDRLEMRTVKALAWAYLPRATRERTLIGMWWVIMGWYRTRPLDLTDPGTAHTLMVALALYRGYDPGVGALKVAWERMGNAWVLTCGDQWLVFEPEDAEFGVVVGQRNPHGDDVSNSYWCNSVVVNEPDPVKALALAVAHVLT